MLSSSQMSSDGTRPASGPEEVPAWHGSGGGVEGEALRLDPPQSAGSPEIYARLERGEISVGAYLQARIDEAVQSLEGTVPPEELQSLRESFARELEADPTVQELVRRASLEAAANKGGSSG
jgi:hypothetical protein